ncbi:MAG: hypothetical protein HPKKFMNG_00450 [Planctomycetes bacterium]|nr:hypothetical protein [Planctomycetota bacterium]MCQ3950186.1 hypothetical protein [Planctomycetota bacterium]HRJ79848.1 hypothetical protein [Planctomycetota bacterium]
MFKPLAVVLGAALSLGAGQLAAQRFEIVKPAEGVGRAGASHHRGCGTYERVWVEEFEMVEERYQEPGRFEHRERKIWVEEQHITVTEQVLVPESKVLVNERVLVPESKYYVEKKVYVEGQIVEYDETMEFASGHKFTFRRLKYVPAHWECRKIEKVKPAYYEDRQVERCVPAHYVTREVVKCIPGHFETVCEKVWVEGCFKTRMVKKVTGGHYELRLRR